MLDPARGGIEPHLPELVVEVACALRDLGRHVAAEALGDSAHLLERESQRLAHLTCRRARAVGDDVGGHTGAVRSVALVDILNDLLALVARRQVEVDIRPLTPLLGQEALEEQLHLDRVDGGDGERVADRRVGSRASPLGHDALALAEADDVPDDEEVARQVELPDQVELTFELCLGACGQWTEAGAGAVPGDPPQVGNGAFSQRQGVVGESITEVVEGELELVGDVPSLGHRSPLVGEEERHLTR